MEGNADQRWATVSICISTILLADDLRGPRVRRHQPREDRNRDPRVGLSRRPDALVPTLERHHVWLVDRAPQVHHRRELADHLANKVPELLDDPVILEAALGDHPAR